MAFSDGDGDKGSRDDSRHSSNSDGSIQSSGLKATEKDELSVSHRGNTAPKGDPTTILATNTLSIEDQLNQLSKQEEKSWKHLDSVHSNHRFGTQYLDGSQGNASSDSVAFDDSCASFDTFGGAGEDTVNLSDSASDLLADQKAAFCNLEPEITPRRKILSTRTPSSRLIRAPSSRMSNLQLIEEDDL